MIKMKWNTFAGGTSSKDGTNSYSARGWFGLFTIDPPSAMRPRSGYAVRWANETGLPVKHTSGLWSDVGSFVSPAAAKTAASAYVEKHLKEYEPSPFAGVVQITLRGGTKWHDWCLNEATKHGDSPWRGRIQETLSRVWKRGTKCRFCGGKTAKPVTGKAGTLPGSWNPQWRDPELYD